LAVLDVEQNAVVVRIVYDGPPEAGKTTSLRALSASLARPMTTPAEVAERTLYFDWLEYTGGLFEGHQIRCQIVSVPGQTELAHRRRALLESADVVVFVSDSAPDSIEAMRTYMTEMRATLDALPGPPVGAIVQANKRDAANAVDMATLRAAMPDRGVAVLESVAREGRGVREAFVFAVRLALDRVRELLRQRALELGPPPVQSSDELLGLLKMREPGHSAVADALQATVLASTPAHVVDAVEPDVPLVPDHNVPPGLIWPPVDGRVLLLDACATPFVPRQTQHGDWIGEAGRWRFQSPARASYANPELGRRALIDWARIHSSAQRWFSSPRTIVLASSGAGAWRLWQIVKVGESLREQLARATDKSPAALLRGLLDAGRLLLSATEWLTLAPCRLPITIDTIGASNDGPLYVGFVPDPFLARPSQPIAAADRPTLIRRELSALASAELAGHDGTTFPPLLEIVRENDPAAVIEALHDVLQDAGLIVPPIAPNNLAPLSQLSETLGG
jgi:signal recognition particle receptor subunit beta